MVAFLGFRSPSEIMGRGDGKSDDTTGLVTSADAILYGRALRSEPDPMDLDVRDLWISGAYFEDYKGWSGTSGWIVNSPTLPRRWTDAVGQDAHQLLPGQLMCSRIDTIDAGEYSSDHVVDCDIDKDPGRDQIAVSTLDGIDIIEMAAARYSRETFLRAVEALLGEGVWCYHPGGMALCYMVPTPTTDRWCQGVIWCRHTTLDRTHERQALKQHLLE